MSEMIKRVARAIEAEVGKLASYDNIPGFYDVIARACIQALHDPTDAMIQAGDNVESAVSFVLVAEDVWRAMIAEALK